MTLPLAPGRVAMRKTLGIIASYRRRFIVVLALQITAVATTLVAPQLLGRLVSRVSAGIATVAAHDLQCGGHDEGAGQGRLGRSLTSSAGLGGSH